MNGTGQASDAQPAPDRDGTSAMNDRMPGRYRPPARTPAEIAAANDAYWTRRRAQARAASEPRRLRYRAQVLAHYGRECACCGTTDRLTIDHVNGDGGQHRAEIGNGTAALDTWLIRHGFPDGFQTLCLPCNQSKGTGQRCRLEHETAEQSEPPQAPLSL